MGLPVKTKRTVLLALTSSHHHGVFRGIARYAREHHWHLVADMIYTAKIPLGWRGDGIISYIGYRNDLAKFILASGLPAVEISQMRSDINLPRVEGDSEMIGRLAAEHFLERGFRNFAWASMLDDILSAERCRGFTNRLAKEGFTCRRLPSADTTLDWSSRRKLLIQQLKLMPKPLAVFCFNDCVAADIIDACNNAGLLVPEAVAVLGIDNDTLICEGSAVPLSSVCHDLEGMAYQAAALLDRLMAGRKPPKHVLRVPPTGLITRRSTDILAVENLQVARALRFIHDHYANPLLGVDDVVAATNHARRQLERAFQQELKRTINDEIVRVRLGKVKELLVNSEMKVVTISAACGFTSPGHLFRTFRKFTATSPKKYRAKSKVRKSQSV
jgi:LacI family transcriptional regulator